MNIKVNNKAVVVEEHATLETVIGLLEKIPTGRGGIAAAVNNELVTRDDWATHTLNEGDFVLIIKAANGG
jgi:sulfur carrier protein